MKFGKGYCNTCLYVASKITIYLRHVNPEKDVTTEAFSIIIETKRGSHPGLFHPAGAGDAGCEAEGNTSASGMAHGVIPAVLYVYHAQS